MKEGLWRVLLVLVLARAASSQLARAEASLAMEEDQKKDKVQLKQKGFPFCVYLSRL